MRFRWILALMALLLTSCQAGNDVVDDRTKQAVEDVVRVAMGAENDKDVETFLELWTDKGLRAYGVGTRDEIEAGDSDDFGARRIGIVRMTNTNARGGRASTLVDATIGRHQIAAVITRVRFTLVEDDRLGWLLDGFARLGNAPPPADKDVVEVTARDYEFSAPDRVEPNVAVSLSNEGDEPHEITLFKGPDDLDLDRARQDLATFQRGEISSVPEGYQVDNIAFAGTDQTTVSDFPGSFLRGTFVLACYLPEGGFDEAGKAAPGAKTHFELGMVRLLRIG